MIEAELRPPYVMLVSTYASATAYHLRHDYRPILIMTATALRLAAADAPPVISKYTPPDTATAQADAFYDAPSISRNCPAFTAGLRAAPPAPGGREAANTSHEYRVFAACRAAGAAGRYDATGHIFD